MINCAVTIVSGNYLAYARTLGRSLQAAQADFDFHVLVVDRKTPVLVELVKATGLNVSFAEDLGLSDQERLFYKYDIVELNTALKPTFLKQVFALGYKHVLYLDPDIYVYAPLTPVLDALREADIVLTPHALAPAMDGLRPSDVDFLRTGVYNLGFIGLKASAQASAMLDWWESRCLGMGFNDTAFGVFVDQKWVDLVPCYFESVLILRHPGCNVAYWNLHERHVSATGNGSHTVSGQPLIFFHFSGVIPRDPSKLSKHQTRHHLSSGSALHAMVQKYCRTLYDLGHASYTSTPYGFGVLDDATTITPSMRRALLVVPYDELKPFDPASRLQRDLRGAGITLSGARKVAKIQNTMTFNQNDRKLAVANLFLRFMVRVVGPDRLVSMLRYAALMTREANLPAVLLKQPLSLIHRLRR